MMLVVLLIGCVFVDSVVNYTDGDDVGMLGIVVVCIVTGVVVDDVGGCGCDVCCVDDICVDYDDLVICVDAVVGVVRVVGVADGCGIVVAVVAGVYVGGVGVLCWC